jgi:hypothetical protein
MKAFVAVLFVLIFSIPASAKTREVYPVSCKDLWTAVTDTVGDHRNYGIMFSDDDRQRASFVVVGTLVAYTHKVALAAKDNGCEMTAEFLQVGADDSEWRQFHKRVGRSLASLQAAKPKPAGSLPAQ